MIDEYAEVMHGRKPILLQDNPFETQKAYRVRIGNQVIKQHLTMREASMLTEGMVLAAGYDFGVTIERET